MEEVKYDCKEMMMTMTIVMIFTWLPWWWQPDDEGDQKSWQHWGYM